jgi:hypothetical protein
MSGRLWDRRVTGHPTVDGSLQDAPPIFLSVFQSLARWSLWVVVWRVVEPRRSGTKDTSVNTIARSRPIGRRRGERKVHQIVHQIGRRAHDPPPPQSSTRLRGGIAWQELWCLYGKRGVLTRRELRLLLSLCDEIGPTRLTQGGRAPVHVWVLSRNVTDLALLFPLRSDLHVGSPFFMGYIPQGGVETLSRCHLEECRGMRGRVSLPAPASSDRRRRIPAETPGHHKG